MWCSVLWKVGLTFGQVTTGSSCHSAHPKETSPMTFEAIGKPIKSKCPSDALMWFASSLDLEERRVASTLLCITAPQGRQVNGNLSGVLNEMY